MGKLVTIKLKSADRAALEAIGKTVLDPARRPAAARAGHAQAAAVLAAVSAVWSSSPEAVPGAAPQ